MSWLSDFFTSPQERAGEATWGDIMNQLNINDIPSLDTKYGIKQRSSADVSRSFDPARANLATRRAQSMSGAAARIGGGNAMPELTYGDIDSKYATAFGNLETGAAKKGLDVERSDEEYAAKLLKSIQGMHMDAAGNYVKSLSNASTFDDILSLGGTAAKFLNPFSANKTKTPAADGSDDSGVSDIDPSQFQNQDYSKLWQLQLGGR